MTTIIEPFEINGKNFMTTKIFKKNKLIKKKLTNPYLSLMKDCKLILIPNRFGREKTYLVPVIKFMQEYPCEFIEDKINNVQTIPPKEWDEKYGVWKTKGEDLDKSELAPKKKGVTILSADVVDDAMIERMVNGKKESLSDKEEKCFCKNPNCEFKKYRKEDVKEKLKEFMDWLNSPAKIIKVDYSDEGLTPCEIKAREIFGSKLVQ